VTSWLMMSEGANMDSPMDYQKLLKKYMNHVQSQEGVFFIPMEFDREFMPEERAELRRIADMIDEKSV
jgi:hypothetical protein